MRLALHPHGSPLHGAMVRVFALALALVLGCGAQAAWAREPVPAGPPALLSGAPNDPAADGSTLRVVRELTETALGLLGVRYRMGGTDPRRGLDCSGLVQYVYSQVTGVSLPRTARELARIGQSVDLADLVAGDLVFFNTRRREYSHVGIYLGDGKFVHAPRGGKRVEVSALAARYWQQRFNGARRLAGSVPGLDFLAPPDEGDSDAGAAARLPRTAAGSSAPRQ